MYSQSFSPQNLYSCTTQTERRNRGLGKDEFVSEIGLCVGDSIDKGVFQFKIRSLEKLFLNNQLKGTIEYLCQDLVLRKLYKNIKRIYKVEQSNRNQIVRQMVSLLDDDSPKWVVRFDIRHFFESIDHSRLIERFQVDGRLNYQSISLLKILFANPLFSTGVGLPRGLSISSVMSELYLKYFDFELRRMEGVFYYARFVDDIIVFCSNETSQEYVWEQVPKLLSEIGLQLNLTKSYKWDSLNQAIKLSYLGYTFLIDAKKKLEVLIADRKINVIKTRITKSFVRFANDGNFEILKKRIKFLTGNCTLYNPTTLLPIKVGIYFNYNMTTNKTSLYELDRYYQKILHCKTGRLGSRLAALMSVSQRFELTKYSFVFGFDHHVNHYFTSVTLAEITDCWL